MAENIIEVKIDKLAGLGDGAGIYEGKKAFVPYTAAGDVVKARVFKETADAVYASLEEVITPGSDRITPVCRHFGVCGGCTLQHLKSTIYLDFKQKMAAEAARKAGFDAACVEDIIKIPAASRRRADLKVSNGRIGYYSERSHIVVDIEECKVLEPELFELVMQIKKQLPALPTLTGIQINGVDKSYDVVLEGEDSSKWQVASDKRIKRLSVRNRSSIKTIYQSSEVTIKLGDVVVDVPPGAFLQASREAQAIMTELVRNSVADSKNIIDLFAGIGTYSFPLSANARVTAIEGDKAMVLAMQKAAKKHGLGTTFKTEARDLFQSPLTHTTLKGYDAAVINPPRMGAKSQSEQLALSGIPKVTMVSCNPATFTRDARILKEAGYQLKRVTPIDQFVYSSHLELVAEFIK